MGKIRLLNVLSLIAILAIPIAVPLSGLRLSLPAEAQGNVVVDISLVTTAPALKVGDNFQVDIKVEANGQPIVGVEAYLRFDPASLEVVDSVPGTAGIQMQPGNTFPNIIGNKANNADGTASFSAVVSLSTPSSDLPSGTFVLATATFKVKTAAMTQIIVENADEPRNSSAIYEGKDVLRSVRGLNVTAGSAPAPGTQTPIPPPTTPPPTTLVPSPKPTPTASPAPTTPPVTKPPATASPTATVPAPAPQITVPVAPPTPTVTATPGTPAAKTPTTPTAPAPAPSPSPAPAPQSEGVAWWIWAVVGVVVVALVSFIVVKARR